ncbi:MAG: iron-sulfur cluster assembly protein [Betaproteobacteria bacterium]
MSERMEEVTLTRDCAATMVPWGTPETLKKGSLAAITQRLGESITVRVDGNLYRIEGGNADALGLEAPTHAAGAASAAAPATAEEVEALAWEKLTTCYDPEIPINIVELGLVYDLRVLPPVKPGEFVIAVVMTVTAPGCGMGNILADEAREKLLEIPGVTDAKVRLTFEPPWSQDRMSMAARLESGLI